MVVAVLVVLGIGIDFGKVDFVDSLDQLADSHGHSSSPVFFGYALCEKVHDECTLALDLCPVEPFLLEVELLRQPRHGRGRQ